jgi:metallo-beta-lactamase family protein
MKIHFLGGAGTVTGSRFLVETTKYKALVDCGLFQGLKDLRLANWKDFPVSPDTIDSVLLTHAHLDHSGYIPKLIREGFRGKIYATEATRDLCKILLPDSGYLQEEQAEYMNRKKISKHSPALPLYTEKEAELSLQRFQVIENNSPFQLGPMQINFQNAGHILGASSIRVEAEKRSIMFSGDLGRYDDLLMAAPKACPNSDYIVMESTYGNKKHPNDDLVSFMENLIRGIIKNKGVLLIPSFAVGRTQSVLYLLHLVFKKFTELRIPIYVNSPMATDVTKLFERHTSEHKLNPKECHIVCESAKFVRTVDESKRLNESKGPMIIISASGMLTGGRILHHLIAFGSDPKNAILLPGFQAAGTRGYTLASGEKELKIYGRYVPINAKVYQTNALSAHADQRELLQWVGSLKKAPIKLFLVHGEPSASDALRLRIKDQLKMDAHIPFLGEVFDTSKP